MDIQVQTQDKTLIGWIVERVWQHGRHSTYGPDYEKPDGQKEKFDLVILHDPSAPAGKIAQKAKKLVRSGVRVVVVSGVPVTDLPTGVEVFGTIWDEIDRLAQAINLKTTE